MNICWCTLTIVILSSCSSLKHETLLSNRPIILSGNVLSGTTLRYHLRNQSDQYLAILKWDTPFAVGDDGILSGDSLRVVDANDSPARYTGRMVNFVDLNPKSILVMRPNGELICDVDLSRSYSLKRGAEYAVSWSLSQIPVLQFRSEGDLNHWLNRINRKTFMRVRADLNSVQLSFKVHK
jgi:hypothetical protein